MMPEGLFASIGAIPSGLRWPPVRCRRRWPSTHGAVTPLGGIRFSAGWACIARGNRERP